MELKRTTIRLTPQLKLAAQKKALDLGIPFQDFVSLALTQYLSKRKSTNQKKLVFNSKNIGIPIDGLTREHIYSDHPVLPWFKRISFWMKK